MEERTVSTKFEFYQHIRETYNIQTCNLLKQYSREVERLAKSLERVKFLQKCRQFQITPSHIKDSTHRINHLFSTTTMKTKANKIESNLHMKLLNLEIKETHTKTSQIKYQIKKLESDIKVTLRETDLAKFKKGQWNKFYKIRSRVENTHKNKLDHLRKTKFKKLNLIFNEDWFINFTTIEFEMEMKWLLSLGNKFALPINVKNFAPIPLIADIEQWVQTIKDETIKEITRSRIANRIANYKRKIKNTEKEKFILNIYEQTKRFINKHKEIITITTSDKGNKTVIMYTNEYKEKMNELLKDRKTYKLIRKDPTENLQRKNNMLITELYKNNNITKWEKYRLFTHAANAPQLYGLPKIHKDNVPLRPISSSMNVPCYNLSKYIGQILKNIVSPIYNVRNSQELKQKLIGNTINNGEIMVSFDVVSLFTNIPIHLAIKNIMDKWQLIKEHTNINKRLFLKILQFCLNENNYFICNNKIYQQSYGMPMGNPLSPTIADIVLDTLLDDATKELQSKNIEIKCLTKYVDDLFGIIKKTEELTILKTLNTYHNRIKFTIEKEENGQIPYLDINIVNDGNKIITNWYRKSTSSGRMINYNSTQPLQVKINTATNFIKKVIQLSDRRFQKENINIIRNTLRKNNYPTYITNKLIDKTINKNDKPKTTQQKEKNFYSVPYIPRLTETKTLKSIIQEETTTITHKSNKTTRELYTNNKTKTEKLKTNNIVYEIKCRGNEREQCNLVYIGTTKRMLGVRANEHKNDIKKGKDSTALSQHAIKCKHVMDFDNIKILDKEKRTNKRYTLESLRIQQKIHTTMNTKEDKDSTKLQYSAAIF